MDFLNSNSIKGSEPFSQEALTKGYINSERNGAEGCCEALSSQIAQSRSDSDLMSAFGHSVSVLQRLYRCFKNYDFTTKDWSGSIKV